MYLEVEVRSRREAARAYSADHGPRADSAAGAQTERRQVRVPTLHPVAVRDPDEVPEAARVPAREHDTTGPGRSHAGPVRGREVDPRMEPKAARPEAVGDGCANRTGHGKRRAGRVTAKRSEGRRSRGPVRDEARPTLKTPKRSVGARTEMTVEVPRREPSPREQELERRDVPTSPAEDQHAAADGVTPELAEGTAGLTADHPVDDEPRAALKADDRPRRLWPADAVDRPVIGPARV